VYGLASVAQVGEVSVKRGSTALAELASPTDKKTLLPAAAEKVYASIWCAAVSEANTVWPDATAVISVRDSSRSA
jgi:hypothetical protein